MKCGSIVGHLPKKISSMCSLFLRHGGVIVCRITDSNKRYSRDLEQGSLEIPCLLLFQAKQKLLGKVCKLLLFSEKSTSEAKLSGSPCNMKQEAEQEADIDDVAIASKVKRIKVEPESPNCINVTPEVWATCVGTNINLYHEDKVLVETNQRLSDKHINFAQAMLHGQFPQCDGLKNTLLQGRHKYSSVIKMVQILHVRGDHWVVISNLMS